MSKNNTEKKTILPLVRFPEFEKDGEWTIDLLRNLAKKITTRNSSISSSTVLTNSAQYGIIKQDEYFNRDIVTKSNISSYFLVEGGDYVYNPRVSIYAPVGPISKNKFGLGVVSPIYTVFRFKNTNNDFYEHYFRSTFWYNYIKEAANNGARYDRMNITSDAFFNMPVPFPLPKEQQKIADCLSSIDALIDLETQKFENLKNYKKGLMQKLFPAEDEIMPEFRFPEFQNEEKWKEKMLSCYLTEHKLKNDGDREVCSVSVHKRVINQVEHLGRSFAATDTSKYNLVQPYDIVYTKSPTGDFPFGIVKQSLNQESVIVSPFYGVFTPSNKYLGYLIDIYFESPSRANLYLDPITKKGAKNTINISNNIFLSGKICLPHNKNEQKKIADYFLSIDCLLKAQDNKIKQLKEHKKGLLQKLFPSFEENKE